MNPARTIDGRRKLFTQLSKDFDAWIKLSDQELGQPILVGHHSERRHRRDIERMQSGMHTSFEEGKNAQDLRRRAAAVGSAGISSDDPEAIIKLKEKLATLNEEREDEKRANALIRAADKTHRKQHNREMSMAETITAIESFDVPERIKDGLRRHARAFRTLPKFGSNTTANIRQVEQRIQALEREHAQRSTAAESGSPVSTTIGIATVTEDHENNRLAIKFPSRADADPFVERLQSEGWHWNRRGDNANSWTRQLNNGARASAKRILTSNDVVTKPAATIKWESDPGIVGVQAPLSFGDDYVISHRNMQHTLSYRPTGLHTHVGQYETPSEAFDAAEQHKRSLATQTIIIIDGEEMRACVCSEPQRRFSPAELAGELPGQIGKPARQYCDGCFRPMRQT